jgi:N-acetylglucosamine-6-phosphate deacetylase
MAQVKLAIPGFVDLQVNGFRGVDFSSPGLTEADCVRACRELAACGTMAFLPTVITSPTDLYQRNLPLLARMMETDECRGHMLGLHLEGPFISPAPGAVGAHRDRAIRKPDIAFFDQLVDWAQGKIKLITIAADQEGAADLARHAVDCDVTVALGHHLASDEEITQLTEAGATALTHLGNGVSNMLPRHPNPIWAGLANDNLSAMLITDGHHLPASTIKAMIRAKGITRTIITSDAAPLAGMAPGRYQVWGGEVVLEASGLLHDPVHGNLAGSSATMLECMNYLASLRLLTLDELLEVGFYNPLRLIGIDSEIVVGKSSLVYDKDRDEFVVSL